MKRTFYASALTLLLMLSAPPGRAADAPEPIDVWPGKVPGETGQVGPEKVERSDRPLTLIKDVSKPTLSIFRPDKETDTGAAVVINPGGGYGVLAWDLEGEEIARWLNSIGVTGIVLKYRVPSRAGQPRYLAALQDAQRAMSLVRSKAAELGIDPARIGMLGFSAGGNLAAITCTQYDRRAYEAEDEVDKVSCRPDFAILIYPAWLSQETKDELVPEVVVNAKTPPMFLAHAGDDLKVEDSVVMYLALQRAKVPAELHVYAKGGHGFGMRKSDDPCSHWPERCAEWLRSQKLLDRPAK